MLKKVVEFFIPVSDTRDNEYQRRVRLIAYTLFTTAVFSLFYVAISWTAGFVMGEIIMFIAFLVFAVLLVLVKAGLDIIFISNFFGLAGIGCISGSIYFSGGLQSPVLPWLATTPIVILLLAGKKSGSFWAFIAVLVVIVLSRMTYKGYVFPYPFLYKNIFFTLSCYSGLILIIFFISILFENVRERAFNAESLQKKELQETITELKSTQAQLIQSEKMASLGELTAGIAHEIQNPLNFINNFSEVNTELIAEMKEAIEKGNYEEVIIIANDIEANEEKINNHGQRADAIVKGMLQHSRKNTGIKEPTDINALCDEYLRLSYHGLRAKEKDFSEGMPMANAIPIVIGIITNFDNTIDKINIVPQDIGRVLLNLFNNAFYAVQEKKKNLRSPQTASEQVPESEEYKPAVTVSTSIIRTRSGDAVIQLTVKDNGAGIPQKIMDKIFQPFFTTKPSGQGTGLGLSLSYDIIKAHGGEIKVESKEGEGSKFIIQLYCFPS